MCVGPIIGADQRKSTLSYGVQLPQKLGHHLGCRRGVGQTLQRLLAASFYICARCGCICARFGWRGHGAAGCLANATAGWHDLSNTGKRHLDSVEWVGFYDDRETWFFITLLEVACLPDRNA